MKTNKAIGKKAAGNGAGSSLTFRFRRFFLIIFVLMISSLAHAQSDTTDLPEIELIFVAEKMPTYPGGDEARMRYINDNATYTQAAKDANATGIVYLTFIVEADGSITQARILKGVHPDLDSISLDLVNRMPNWIPAEQRGKPVRCQFTMPIRFGPEMSKYWRKEGEKRFLKTCEEQYGKSRAECDCWFNFIIWNYNDKTLKSLDLDEIFKSQKCE
jgi:TonB family protein